MATPKEAPLVDLFGNSTLTPAQIAREQIATSIKGAEESFSGGRASTKTAAMLGAGMGGLFRQVMMDTGLIKKDPAQEKAEKMAVVRETIRKDTKEKGIDLTKDPEAYTSLAVKHFLDAGMDDVALKAMQVGQLFGAQKRAAALEQSTINKNNAGAAKDLADAEKAKVDAAAAPALNAAKLDELQSSATLNRVKAHNYNVLTKLKVDDPVRAKHVKFDEIVSDLLARQKKDPKARFTPGQRTVLDELHKADPINRMLGQTLGGAEIGATDAPEVFDFTSTP